MQVSTRIVVPAAISGIIASFVLAISRAVGETMIVLIAAGGQPNLTLNPTEAVQTMTAFIAATAQGDVATGTIAYKTIFAVGATLFVDDAGDEHDLDPPRPAIQGGIRVSSMPAPWAEGGPSPRLSERARVPRVPALLARDRHRHARRAARPVLLAGWQYVDAVLLFEPPSADPRSPARSPRSWRRSILGVLLILFTVPIGVGTAVYLEEYADRERWYNRWLEINIQNLAAVPSIVYGILGLAFLVRGLGLGRVLLAGAFILTLLVLPTVIIAAREAIRAVPGSIREGAYALGATQWQVVWRQVLAGAAPGIATGSILALSRALGETAPLLLVGALTYVSFNPTPCSAISRRFPCRSSSTSPGRKRSSGGSLQGRSSSCS